MMWERISAQIEEAVEKYSYQGDNTLECIGLTVQDEGKLSCKVYRIKKNNSESNMLFLPSAVRKRIAQVENNNPDLTFFDYSARQGSRGEMNYSVSFKVKNIADNCGYLKNEVLSKQREKVEQIVSTFQTEAMPLIQIGFLVDECDNTVESKYYFTLNQNIPRCTPESKIRYVTEHKREINRFVCTLFGNENSEIADEILSVCVSNEYRPFLLGINETAVGTENKLYFVLNDRMEKEKYLSAIDSIITCFDMKELMSEALKLCDKKGLFIRGFAVGINNGKVSWRFYFFPVKYLESIGNLKA